MKRPVLIALAATSALICLGGWLHSSGERAPLNTAKPPQADPSGIARSGSTAGVMNVPALAPRNVLAIRPRPSTAQAPSDWFKGIDAAAPYQESRLAKMHADGAAGKVLLEHIAQMDNDGEALLMKADILARCATMSDDKWTEAMKGTAFETREQKQRDDPRGEFLK